MIGFAAPLLAGALVLVVLFDLRRRAADRHDAQMRHLSSSHELLDSHCASLTAFLNSPEPPERLKETLVRLSDIVSDREAILKISDALRVRKSFTLSDEDSEMALELDRLSSTNPDLTREFMSAVITGLMSGLLRWPETSFRFEEVSARVLSDPEKELALTATIRKFQKADGGFTRGLGHIGAAA